jgi:hypothetical protein
MHEDVVLVRADVWVRKADVAQAQRRLTEAVSTLTIESARVSQVKLEPATSSCFVGQ